MFVHRITGKHSLVSETGAAIWLDDVAEKEVIVTRIKEGARRLQLAAEPKIHLHKHGMVVAIEAPTDLLYTACELLEWASDPLAEFDRVEQEYQQEKNIAWRQLKSWAVKNMVPHLEDEDGFTLGLGRYSRTWPLQQLPEIGTLSKDSFGGIPCVYITGTNGKTTSSRLLAKIARTAGYSDGLTSSDGVLVGGEWVERGDWTGPGAARMVLRHPEVDFAVLETARGGLMRRGLVLCDVNAAAVTNVSDDHLGHWGLHTVEDMALAKLTVALGIRKGGTLILNADCAALVAAWEKVKRTDIKVLWFSSKTKKDVFLDGDWIVHRERGEIISIQEIPLTLNGTAIHNVENAMVAIGLACELGISIDAIQKGLKSLYPTPESSRGRSNWYRINGADIILDFAHNPDGVKRLVEVGHRWNAKRTIIFLGQASDRSDAQIYSLAREAARLQADRYIIKELPEHAYGEDPRKVVEQIQAYLIEEGIQVDNISCFSNELLAVQHVLLDLQEEDLVLLIIHENLDAVLELLKEQNAQLVEAKAQR